jgi:1-acyl-sn-glycerol-3-phosphate acyltransferase
MSSVDRISYQAMRLGARALAARRLEIEVTGLKHIPAYGPVLLVARHYHHLFDGIVLLVSIPRPVHILVTLDWAENRYVRRLMTLATTMARWPVVLRSEALRAGDNDDRVRHASAFTSADINRYQRKAISDSVELLRQGHVLVVFPEGYPNIDPHSTRKADPGQSLPFKSGFAAIAAAAEKRLGAKVPLLPIGLAYTKSSRWTARLNIGERVYLEDFVSRGPLVDYMEQRVAELSRSDNSLSAGKGRS